MKSPIPRHAQAEVVLTGTDSNSLVIWYVHVDHLGSGHVITKADGSLLTQEEYFPYGRASDRRDSRNRYRFIGVERDEHTGLCMVGPRTYDALSGRFMQRDPLVTSNTMGWTPYHYAYDAPQRFSDTNGLEPEPRANPAVDWGIQVPYAIPMQEVQAGNALVHQEGRGSVFHATMFPDRLEITVPIYVENPPPDVADLQTAAQRAVDREIPSRIIARSSRGKEIPVHVTLDFVAERKGANPIEFVAGGRSKTEAWNAAPHSAGKTSDFESVVVHEVGHLLGAPDEYGAATVISRATGEAGVVLADPTAPSVMERLDAPIRARQFYQVEQALNRYASGPLTQLGPEYAAPWSVVETEDPAPPPRLKQGE